MLTFKIADSAHERAQIEALCYRTFVEEIPQHQPNEARLHVDRFHDENVYAISMDGDRLVGMLAIRDRRPFSLDAKLPDLDAYLPAGRTPCEVRLLAIEKEHRHGPVLPGLLSVVWEHAASKNFDCAVISGTTRQLKLYGRMGFEPFGPLVGTVEAAFQPMLITRERFVERVRRLRALPPSARGEKVCFLPGPVRVHEEVKRAFGSSPESHRSEGFVRELAAVRERLANLVNARHAAVLVGSGTLANDCVAAQLTDFDRPGVVVSNGEFGERLVDHARRFRLPFRHARLDWGMPLDEAQFAAILHDRPAWVWIAACETSCGVMNDVATLTRLCAGSGTKVCVDSVSAVGAVPLDFSGVHLATAVSGKALGAFPGLAIVFHNDPVQPSTSIPRYLDLGMYAAEGVPFTHSSNLVAALDAAMRRVDWPSRYDTIARDGAWLRSRLEALGFAVVASAANAAPHVVTIAVDDAEATGRALDAHGYAVAWASDYLRRRGWIQLAIMGETSRRDLEHVLRELTRCTAAQR